ncbi:MAG TPA: hypothetical protein VNC22_01320, partial [Sporichthya sp.]|nr:hypothetical protein [Sporichthya sp.]
RFSSPRQGLLAARAARPYRDLPVRGLRVENARTLLDGVVTLRVDAPLEAVAERREIHGVVRDCIVIRLTEEARAGFPLPEEAARLLPRQASVFERFAGPCGGRPESRTCGDPQPVEFVGGVGPDCDGVVTVEFAGCARLARLADRCGVVVDCELGLADACLPPRLPSSDGVLPGTYEAATITPPAAPAGSESVYSSESRVVLGGLPHVDCFTDLAADDFSVKGGLWGFQADDSPGTPCDADVSGVSEGSESVSSVRRLGCYATLTAAARNVSVWEGFDVSTAYRRVTTDLLVEPGPAGARHNAGLVLNHRPHDTAAGQFVYHLVSADYDQQRLTVQRWTGAGVVEVTHVDVPGLRLSRWYRLSVEATPLGTTGQTQLDARLTSAVGDETDVTLSVAVSNYRPSTGRFGFHANRALARFAYFQVEGTD